MGAVTVRALADTSVLIADQPVPDHFDLSISCVSIAELHFGLLAVRNDDERAIRAARLGLVEARFSPLPVDSRVAREWGRLKAAVASRGGRPRRRTLDLAIAATANVHGAHLLTRNPKDFALVSDLVRVVDASQLASRADPSSKR